MIKELLFRKRPKITASAASIEAIERDLGLSFPGALVEFCQKWNGGYPAPENEFYPVPLEFKEFHEEYKNSGIHADGLLGVTDDFPSCSLAREYSLLNPNSIIGIVPISFDLFGNYVVLRADSLNGNVFFKDRELWDANDRPRLIPIAARLEDYYNGLSRS